MVLESQSETAPALRMASRPRVEARGVIVSLNPRAGSRSRHDRVREIADCLEKSGFSVRLTSDLAELAALSVEGLELGNLRAVLAVGGDGTASVVRNHVPLEIPMVPIPMGTENLLGRYVAQTIEPEDVCQTVKDGVVVGLDLGNANGKHFLLMVSAGFDAEVVRALHETRRGNITRGSYVMPTLRTVLSYRYPRMSVSAVEPEVANQLHSCRWLFGFNLPLYALGLPIAPDASSCDGKLDVCTFARGNFANVMRYLWHVQRHAHTDLDDTVILRTAKLRLEAEADAIVPYQIDGDYGGNLPLDVEMIAGGLRLLVSPEAARRLGFEIPPEVG